MMFIYTCIYIYTYVEVMLCYLLKTFTSKEDRSLFYIIRQNNFLSTSRIRMELARRTGHHFFVDMVQRCLAAAGYRSRHPAWCPILTIGRHHHRHMLAHRHQNWNHQHWSHVFFADGSMVSLHNCNGHARVFHRVVVSLVDCCIQETDGILVHDDQIGRGWRTTHNQISHDTNYNCLNVLSHIQLLLNVLGTT